MLLTIHQFKDPSYTREQLIAGFGPTERGILQNVIGKDCDKAWPFFLSMYEKLSVSLHFKAFDGIPSLLKELSQNPTLHLVLLTGRSKETLAISMKSLGISSLFERCYSGSDAGINKDISMMQMLKDYSLTKDETLYIGDTLEDVATMRKVSVDILSAGYSHDLAYQKALEKVNPGHVAHAVSELQEKLFRLLPKN